MSHKMRGVDRRQAVSGEEFPLTTPSGGRVDADRRSGGDRRQIDGIARQPIFSGVAVSKLETLIGHCEFRELAVGELLLSPGQVNHYLFLLLDGLLDVHIDRPDGEFTFQVRAGEYVGEVSLVDGRPATAFVVAAEPCRLLAVPETYFWSEFVAVPEIARNFLRFYAERFRARNQTMRQALEDRLRYEHLEKELAIAQQIQAGMLPHHLDLLPGVDIVAKMEPARLVGGDFYDAFPVAGGRYCFAVGDVSGKGVPAALFMVRSMTLLRAEMQKAESVESAMQRLNAELRKGNEQCMFVTLIVVVLDPATGMISYVVAGHNPMILGNQGGHYRFLPSPHGILAGVAKQAVYESASLALKKGDVLVLYTDGVTEAMSPSQELFTEERLLACLAGAPGLSAKEVAGRIATAVAEFVDGAPPSDDLTMLILRYLGD